MIKELEDDREESQDPEVEFAIAGVMRECNGLDIVLNMVQVNTTYLIFFVPVYPKTNPYHDGLFHPLFRHSMMMILSQAKRS